MSARKIGVYICQCGGNIGDYVDVDEVVAAVEKEQGVTVAKTAMFTCSDSTQSEIVADAQEQDLDGLVIAIDETPVGTFVELEGDEAAIAATAARLGRTSADYVLASYRTLFLEHRATHGGTGDHMVFDPDAAPAGGDA